MRLALILAGVPREYHNDLQASRTSFLLKDDLFHAPPLYQRGNKFPYVQSYSSIVAKWFYGQLENDHHNKLADVGFAICYVRQNEMADKAFIESVFPAIFCRALDWEPDFSSTLKKAQSSNHLVSQLREGVPKIRRALQSVKKELTEQTNRTPLLLPVKNFTSEHLRDDLRDLQHSLARENQDSQLTIRAAVKQFVRNHPRLKIGSAIRPCFVDDRKVEFHPPGTDRHGMANQTKKHGMKHGLLCLLSGRLRLGASYDRGFHYDCTKGTRPLRELFYGCHEPQSLRTGAPHLNIAPNDNVRP